MMIMIILYSCTWCSMHQLVHCADSWPVHVNDTGMPEVL